MSLSCSKIETSTRIFLFLNRRMVEKQSRGETELLSIKQDELNFREK